MVFRLVCHYLCLLDYSKVSRINPALVNIWLMRRRVGINVINDSLFCTNLSGSAFILPECGVKPMVHAVFRLDLVETLAYTHASIVFRANAQD